ncbi:hypothetical protein F5B21DRAFT_45377 [Xylaria acuta]|nr:hypothetical protein F5B21DRAFT_45377 [Xylaria acuta]
MVLKPLWGLPFSFSFFSFLVLSSWHLSYFLEKSNLQGCLQDFSREQFGWKFVHLMNGPWVGWLAGQRMGWMSWVGGIGWYETRHTTTAKLGQRIWR